MVALKRIVRLGFIVFVRHEQGIMLELKTVLGFRSSQCVLRSLRTLGDELFGQTRFHQPFFIS